MKKIKWQFEGLNVFFVSTEKNLALDIMEQARKNGLSLEHKIITIYDDRIITAIPSPSNGISPADEFTAVSMGVKKTKTRKASVELSDVSGDLDDASPATDPLEDELGISLLDGFSDRLAL